MIKDLPKATEILVSFIREQVKGAGLSGCVVGASGGVDSAVVAVLCKRAFPDNTLAVLVPVHSSPESKERALSLCEIFSIEHLIVDLSGIYDSFLSVIQRALGRGSWNPSFIHLGCLKSCLRAPTLDFIAKLRNALVVGTGNKSEDDIGYFNKRGDGAVDIVPIQRLYKSEVYQLAEYLGLPEEIIRAMPTADLWKGQNDEDELGITYDELERALRDPHTTPKDEREKEVLSRVRDLMRKNAHKLNPPPACEIRRYPEVIE